MTKKQVHNVLCDLPNELKMDFALKYSKTQIELFEESYACIYTFLEDTVRKSIDYLNDIM